MGIEFLNIDLLSHYVRFELLKIEIGTADWVGSLFYIQWAEGDWAWDFLFLNSYSHRSVG